MPVPVPKSISLFAGTECANYSLANLHNDGEQILEEIVQEIATDPINKIKGSQYGAHLISVANCFLKNHGLCDRKKFRKILCKLWNVATSGDSKKVPKAQREKMWKAFHDLCLNTEFIEELKCYLLPAVLSQPGTLFIQTLLRKLLEKIVLKRMCLQTSNDCDFTEETEIPLVEENIIRYAAGFVPFSLRRQCIARSKDLNNDEKIQCLNALLASNEDGNPQTFREYTKSWLEKQNRGGLFSLNNEGYLFFKAVEHHCRKCFKQKRIRSISDSSNIKLPVLDAVSRDKVALEHWARATSGRNQSIASQVMQMCIKLWVNIRGHAFAANWIAQFKHLQTAESARKKGLRKNLKNMKI